MQKGLWISGVFALLASFALDVSTLRSGTTSEPRTGFESQPALGPMVWSADMRFLAFTNSDRAGLSILELESGQLWPVSRARGAGFRPLWREHRLYFKEVLTHGAGDESLQQIVCFDVHLNERFVIQQGPRLGEPSLVPGSTTMVWTEDRFLVQAELGEQDGLPRNLKRQALPGYSNIVELDPAGQRVAFSHADGRVGVIALESGAVFWLTDPGAYAHPRWSADGALLLIRGPGRAAVLAQRKSRAL